VNQTVQGKIPKTSWIKERSAFTLSIPETSSVSEVAARNEFAHNFDQLFREDAKPIEDPDWDDVVAEEKPQKVVVSGSHHPIVESLPSINGLARPEVLFSQTLPYRLLVQAGSRSLLIRGTHAPSVELIANYFKKWARISPNMANDVRCSDP
jgi:hypothetical protein